MKTWSSGILAAAMLTVMSAQAQQKPNRLATAIKNELEMRDAVAYGLFTPLAERDPLVDKEINNVVYLKLDKTALKTLVAAKAPLVRLTLPLDNGKTLPFTLNSYSILDNGFKTYERGADGQKREVSIATGTFYRGIVDDQNRSLAAFTFTGDDVAAVVSTPDGGNYNLVLDYVNPGPQRDHYLLFREADIKTRKAFPCGVTEAMESMQKHKQTAARGSFANCAKLRVSMNADYLTYQKRGNSVAGATSYLLALFNVISTLYSNEDINAVVSETVVNSAPDGYTFGSSREVLMHFGAQVHSSFNGDIAHLVTAYEQSGFPPLGGVAWLGTICMPPAQFNQPGMGNVWVGPFGISDNYILDPIPQLPIFSWDVEASAHEMGHNIGSPHTHSCSWPGGPIDDCYPVEDGTCAPGPDPDPSGGTVMSYCHLTSFGINLALGFGPLPGDLLRESMSSSPCISTAVPDTTIASASKVSIANRQCTDGQWTYYYNDNNTAIDTDDEMVLMIQTNGQNIGNVDQAGFQVKVTTEAAYGTNTGRTVTAPYATGGWKEANRSWNVTLSSQPTAAVLIRFPFLDQDVLDIKGSIPELAQASELSAVAFKSQAAAASPATASASAVSIYTNGNTADATHWRLGTQGSYKYAEFSSNYGVFGGSLGFKKLEVGINDPLAKEQELMIYPNPTNSELNIALPAIVKSSRNAVTVYDHLGRVVLSRDNAVATQGTIQLNVSRLASGVYTVRYTNDGASFNGRFVKQ